MLEKANVSIVPGIEFGEKWENWVRISFSKSREALEKAVANIENVVKAL